MLKTKSVQVKEVPAPKAKKLLSIPPSIDADMRLVAHALLYNDINSFIVIAILEKIESFKTNFVSTYNDLCKLQKSAGDKP